LPPGRRALRALLPALTFALAVLLLRAARPEALALAGMRSWAGLALAWGVGLALLPCRDDDLVAASRRELRLWQLRTTAGSLLLCASAWAGAVGVKYARTFSPGLWLAAVILGVCVCAMPLAHRLPLRALAAAALVAAAILLG